MKKFSIEIYENLTIWYSHYLSDKFIKKKECYGDYFKKKYPLGYQSRRFDKPAIKWRNEFCVWCLDDELHRIEKPACIYPDGSVFYWENGEVVK